MARSEFGDELAWVCKGDTITFWLPHALDRVLRDNLAGTVPFWGGNLLGLADFPGDVFLSGASGWVASAAALRLLDEAVRRASSSCVMHHPHSSSAFVVIHHHSSNTWRDVYVAIIG